MSSNPNRKDPFQFADSSRVERILSQYPEKRSAVLPLLHLVQSQEGYIPAEGVNAVATIVGAHPAEIMDAVSFYARFHTEPQGKYILQVCQTLPCSLNGADELVDHVCRKYHIEPGETTEDGRFTLRKVECLGSCGTAPVVQINDDYHEGLSPNEFDKLLESLP
ncbi:MAG: NADH-quinone oxidoreductase subunit NuoE [Fidelibacterota bacterium]